MNKTTSVKCFIKQKNVAFTESKNKTYNIFISKKPKNIGKKIFKKTETAKLRWR